MNIRTLAVSLLFLTPAIHAGSTEACIAQITARPGATGRAVVANFVPPHLHRSASGRAPGGAGITVHNLQQRPQSSYQTPILSSAPPQTDADSLRATTGEHMKKLQAQAAAVRASGTSPRATSSAPLVPRPARNKDPFDNNLPDALQSQATDSFIFEYNF